MKFFKHLMTVLRHKHFVFWNAWRLHIPWLGFIHDLSKFHPTEFFRSVKYFAGDKSPTIVERQYNDGISRITLHHTLRNKHHWHSSVDFLPTGIIIAPIDYRHSLEYVSDILSASKVYMKKTYTIHKAYEYFYNECPHYLMHPLNKEFILWCVSEIEQYGFRKMKKKYTKAKYYELKKKYTNSVFIPFDNFSLSYLDIKESKD